MKKFIPVGTVVGVIDKDRPNYGSVGEVVSPFSMAREIPKGWVWVQFGGLAGDRWWCAYDTESLVSLQRLGYEVFKQMIEDQNGGG